MSDDHSNAISSSSTSSLAPSPSSSSSSSIDSESSSTDLSSNKDHNDSGGPPPKLRVRRRKLSELAPWEIWRCVRCGKCYSKTSKAAILEHVRVLCQAGTHDDEEIRRQMAMYARKQGGWIYSGKKMGLANTYNMNNYTLAPFHPSFPFGQVPFGYFPGAAPATPVNRYANFQQTPLMSSTHNNNNSNNNNNMNNNNNHNAEPSSKRAKYDGVSLAVASVKGTPRSLSSESSSSSGGTSPGSRLSPINHSSTDTSRSVSNDNGNTDNNEGTGYAPYGAMNEFNYGGNENGYQNGYSNNYSNYGGYMNMNYPFTPQQNFNASSVANARRATSANDVSSYYPNAYPAAMNNFVPRASATNGRY